MEVRGLGFITLNCVSIIVDSNFIPFIYLFISELNELKELGVYVIINN